MHSGSRPDVLRLLPRKAIEAGSKLDRIKPRRSSCSWIQSHSVILISELPEVTHKVYLDVVVSHPEPVRGRITLGLFGKALPRTVQNFRALCACDGGTGRISGKPLCYAGTTFYRIGERPPRILALAPRCEFLISSRRKIGQFPTS